MSNWAENPLHQKNSLQGYALPNLLFSECQKYCLPHEFQEAETPGQRACISNCQSKTYNAFDLYMEIAVRHAQKKTYRNYVDISKYTGMEIEHKHDTAGVIPDQHELHSPREGQI